MVVPSVDQVPVPDCDCCQTKVPQQENDQVRDITVLSPSLRMVKNSLQIGLYDPYVEASDAGISHLSGFPLKFTNQIPEQRLASLKTFLLSLTNSPGWVLNIAGHHLLRS